MSLESNFAYSYAVQVTFNEMSGNFVVISDDGVNQEMSRIEFINAVNYWIASFNSSDSNSVEDLRKASRLRELESFVKVLKEVRGI